MYAVNTVCLVIHLLVVSSYVGARNDQQARHQMNRLDHNDQLNHQNQNDRTNRHQEINPNVDVDYIDRINLLDQHHQTNHWNQSDQLNHLSQFDQTNVSECPLWYTFNTTSHKCQHFFYYGAKFFDNHTYLYEGFCASHDNTTGLISFSPCPYFQSDSLDELERDSVWYTKLPTNISTLNAYICGPMNRKGRVCSECEPGYGPSITSVGFQIQCAKCVDYRYGILLYLFVELFPITVFYLVILVFQVSITSAPMTCYIMYSQLIVIWWSCAFDGEDSYISKRLFIPNKNSELFLRIILSIYDVWNLRFFHYLIPPFCISAQLRPIHIGLLSYASVFYPLLLIALTWLFIELHGRNFRPLVLFWKPFHRCFVCLRRRWNAKSDIVDVFASFFLLSFSKVMYQMALLLSPQTIQNYDRGKLTEFVRVTNIDLNVAYGSREHLTYAIPAIILCLFLNVLPTLLLIFYPFKTFRALLSRCKLDGIAINFFVEKFYTCYRNGLDGGRDMRSFAGLYFILRPMMFVVSIFGSLCMVSNNDPYLSRSLVLLTALLVTSLCRPYKKMYMNVLDSLLLAHFCLFCHLVSAHEGFQVKANFAATVDVMLVLPFCGFVLVFVAKIITKATRTKAFDRLCQKCKRFINRNRCRDENMTNYVTDNSLPTERLLTQQMVTVTEINYGTIAS